MTSPSAEEVLAARKTQVARAQQTEQEELRRIYNLRISSLVEEFDNAMKEAAARLERAGYLGGTILQYWRGGSEAAEVAVWPIGRFSRYDDPYYFSPTLGKLLVQYDRGEQHQKDVTNKRENPNWWNAINKGWLFGIEIGKDEERLRFLIDRLSKLGPQ